MIFVELELDEVEGVVEEGALNDKLMKKIITMFCYFQEYLPFSLEFY